MHPGFKYKNTTTIAIEFLILSIESPTHPIEKILNSTDWQKAAEGELSNIKYNPLEQLIQLSHQVSTRYFKFSILHVLAGNGITVVELGVTVN